MLLGGENIGRKNFFTLVIGLAMIGQPQLATAQCTGQCPDLNALPANKREELKNLIMEFITTPTLPNQFGVAKYPTVAHHNEHLSLVHGTCTDAFLTWHRWYIQSLGNWLITKGKTEFVPLPKWNPSNCIPDDLPQPGRPANIPVPDPSQRSHLDDHRPDRSYLATGYATSGPKLGHFLHAGFTHRPVHLYTPHSGWPYAEY